MARQKHRSQLVSIDEINMTPLIDLTFLLLIIFMITAPLLEYGIDVSPPAKDGETLPDQDTKVINLDKDGKIVFNRRAMSPEELLISLRSLRGSQPKLAILVRADGNRPYREVINLMKTIESAGFNNVSLVTQAESG